MFKYFMMYIIFINLYTYLLFFVDKQKAKKEARRISEYDLLKFSLMGGVVGALIGMKMFRHKTQKKEFYYRIYIIFAIYIIVILALFANYINNIIN